MERQRTVTSGGSLLDKVIDGLRVSAHHRSRPSATERVKTIVQRRWTKRVRLVAEMPRSRSVNVTATKAPHSVAHVHAWPRTETTRPIVVETPVAAETWTGWVHHSKRW